ncbi:Glycosyl hydrolase 5 family protein [Cardamine amara subsp. amara]|uniref:Glycosyl hydrolase 5 family protein n=1 Tax=Cardamine amara subsp. amara TaxID=228776 RepID=A0ABD1BC33_CARAN
MTTKRMYCIFPFFCFFFLVSQHTIPSMSYPLSTSSRWIVNENGQRVKLVCANWPSHLEPVVAEGLSKQPVDAVAKEIVEMGFNCVRLTWPLDLMTNETLANNVTVRQSFQSIGLNSDILGFQTNNPSIIDLSLIEAFKMVVTTLGNNDVMVILDNHLTKPGWCCSMDDGNGFFGDQFFDPTVWVAALSKMATTFNGVSNVVGMSLRNELRGPNQNVNDWFKYMQQGAEAVHSANKNVLVILSGLSFDTDLSFVRSRPVNISFTEKLVFEMHWYSFSDGSSWTDNNTNDNCGQILNRIKNAGGFLLNQGFPLFISEFGIDERGKNTEDDRYFGCLTGWAAENDVDWSVWALTGSYYLRQGNVGMVEYYGLLDSDWISVRNSSFLQKISLLQSPLQGPGTRTDAYNLVFHPLTGLCLVRSLNDSTKVTLGPCNSSEPWSYTKKAIRIKDQPLCLQSNGPQNPVTMTSCSRTVSKWRTISASRMHLASRTSNKATLCLDVDSTNNVVANACKCLRKNRSCEPMSQWFKIIKATRPLKSSRLYKQISSML